MLLLHLVQHTRSAQERLPRHKLNPLDLQFSRNLVLNMPEEFQACAVSKQFQEELGLFFFLFFFAVLVPVKFFGVKLCLRCCLCVISCAALVSGA